MSYAEFERSTSGPSGSWAVDSQVAGFRMI